MRCLHCGKHLPLFRKLTGGGEFCSDAHRDQYHDEYNRLAVTRLLQAQTRPEEAKPVPKHAQPPSGIAVAVEYDEPEPTESYIDEFQHYDFSPANISTRLQSIEISPSLSDAPQVARPSIQPAGFQPPSLSGFVPMVPGVHNGKHDETDKLTSLASMEGPVAYQASCGMPSQPEAPKQFAPLPGRALTHVFMPKPCAIQMKPLELWVKPVEARTFPAHIEELPFHPEPFQIPVAQRVDFATPRIVSDLGRPPDQGKPLPIGPIIGFDNLSRLRPVFDSGLQLLGENDEEPQASPAPVVQAPALEPIEEQEAETVPDEKLESIVITPRRALDALARLQYPPARTELVSISIPALAPSQAAAVAGFDALPLETKPRLMRLSSVPLRPKMAVGNVSGPITARAGGTRVANGRRPSADAPKNMPRSMLHLEDESHAVAVETDADASSIFGKLGGLFGRKKGH